MLMDALRCWIMETAVRRPEDRPDVDSLSDALWRAMDGTERRRTMAVVSSGPLEA